MHRRFVNLIMRDLRSSIYSLYRMDIRPLFYETAEIAAQVQAAEEAKAKHEKRDKLSMVEESWKDHPKPAVNFKASNFVTLFRENSIMIGDSFGRTNLLDTDFKSVVTTPPMRNGKGPNCICFLIPNPDPLKSKDSQCLYVLDLVPGSSTFEYLTYLGNNDSSRPLVSVPSHYNLDWVWRNLPVPPFVDDPSNCRAAMNCSSMLLDSSTMCVSEEGIGTYTFDMVSRKWSRATWLTWARTFSSKYVQEDVEDETAVLTGLDVRHCNNSEGSEGAVRMIKHMSKRCTFEKFGIHRVL
ncbi:hypothetical protein VPH35_019259 [Triticum aestivum]